MEYWTTKSHLLALVPFLRIHAVVKEFCVLQKEFIKHIGGLYLSMPISLHSLYCERVNGLGSSYRSGVSLCAGVVAGKGWWWIELKPERLTQTVSVGRWRLWLITLVWILIGNSISLSIGGVEDLRPHRGIRTIVLIVAIAINLAKLNMSVTQVHSAMDPVKHTLQFAFVPNVVKVSLKYPGCPAIANLLLGMGSEQLLEKTSIPKQHLLSSFPG